MTYLIKFVMITIADISVVVNRINSSGHRNCSKSINKF